MRWILEIFSGTTDYRADGPGVDPAQGHGLFLPSHHPHRRVQEECEERRTKINVGLLGCFTWEVLEINYKWTEWLRYTSDNKKHPQLRKLIYSWTK